MTRTKIQMIEMTLAPKDRDQATASTEKAPAPQVTPSKESLWGETPAATGITGEPVSSSNPHGGLPSLPGQYSPASLGDDPEF